MVSLENYETSKALGKMQTTFDEVVSQVLDAAMPILITKTHDGENRERLTVSNPQPNPNPNSDSTSQANRSGI